MSISISISKTLSALALGAAIAITQAGAATAQGMQGMGPGTMQSGTDQERMGRGMMQGQAGPGAMGQCMMHGGEGSGMMGRHMGRGMMGSGMMGSGMMRGGGTRSGMSALFGSRVTRQMNLSVDDVRGYLGLQLKRLDNKRLKVGEVKSEDDTIAADIVTVDDSLVQRLKVDRHTGAIQYEN